MEAILNVVQNIDGWILLFIQNHLRPDALTPWVIRFTKLGNAGLIWIVISVLLLIPGRTRRAGILSIAALAVSLCITNLLLKNYVARIRPYEVVSGLTSLLGAVDGYSFPSGHASAGFAAATVISKSCRKWVGWPCLVLACLLSLSRLYVGVHYPSDVICGAIIGFLIGLVIFWLFGGKEYRRRARRARRRRR